MYRPVQSVKRNYTVYNDFAVLPVEYRPQEITPPTSDWLVPTQAQKSQTDYSKSTEVSKVQLQPVLLSGRTEVGVL